MAGYFVLELDTTQPNIEIYAPTYTDRGSNNQIRIVSDERLSDFQDIYIIDSQGSRHNVTFLFNGEDEFTGNVIFSDFPIGLATIYAQLKDEVGNLSNLAIFHMSVITSHDNLMVRLSMSESVRVNTFSIEESLFILGEMGAKKNLTEKKGKLSMSEKSRMTKASDKN